MAVVTGQDIPDEVDAALKAADEATPDSPAEPGGEAAWWGLHAQADEVRAQAFDRLADWARDTKEPAAVLTAVLAASAFYRRSASDARWHQTHERRADR